MALTKPPNDGFRTLYIDLKAGDFDDLPVIYAGDSACLLAGL
ncbi:hypothetical protein ADICYQ_5298 [Cyclobacterium qasimii M12-11B]|uniref:Uncharacterized protein n=1 Tax=Cyclobacterium qasimii M12-11B TaxID=641524 RepID=S7WNA4_9BACT|nr:hypothetical protein ADICYQ_5298 [Cyclobacterium qasimii M12-11B]